MPVSGGKGLRAAASRQPRPAEHRPRSCTRRRGSVTDADGNERDRQGSALRVRHSRRAHAALAERAIEGDRPWPSIDAADVTTREAGRIVSVALSVTSAMNTDGPHQWLGMKGASQAEPFL